jgi:hypothetical protein
LNLKAVFILVRLSLAVFAIRAANVTDEDGQWHHAGNLAPDGLVPYDQAAIDGRGRVLCRVAHCGALGSGALVVTIFHLLLYHARECRGIIGIQWVDGLVASLDAVFLCHRCSNGFF